VIGEMNYMHHWQLLRGAVKVRLSFQNGKSIRTGQSGVLIPGMGAGKGTSLDEG